MSSSNENKFGAKALSESNNQLVPATNNYAQKLQNLSSPIPTSSTTNALQSVSNNPNQNYQIIQNQTDNNVIEKMQHQSRVTISYSNFCFNFKNQLYSIGITVFANPKKCYQQLLVSLLLI